MDDSGVDNKNDNDHFTKTIMDLFDTISDSRSTVGTEYCHELGNCVILLSEFWNSYLLGNMLSIQI